MTTLPTTTTRWELAAETIAVKIRWFGLVVGYLLVNFGGAAANIALSSTAFSRSAPSTPSSIPTSACAAIWGCRPSSASPWC